MDKKMYKATVSGPSKESDGREVWNYTCDCPKIDGGLVGPFDLKSLAEATANLHNRAEPNH